MGALSALANKTPCLLMVACADGVPLSERIVLPLTVIVEKVGHVATHVLWW